MAVLDVTGLKKSYHQLFQQKVNAIDDVTFSIDKGEVVAFLGPNGAGKTTTIKLILGLIRPESGKINIFGRPSKECKLKARVGYLPENPSFYRFLTGKENLKFLTKMTDRNITDSEIEKILEKVGLSEAKNRRIVGYSRGMVQRLGIAQAVVHNPELLILDEPLSGLDPIGRKDVRDLLLTMKGKGKTIFFSTHILPDVKPLADRILVLNKGKIVESSRIDELDNIEDYLMEILQ